MDPLVRMRVWAAIAVVVIVAVLGVWAVFNARRFFLGRGRARRAHVLTKQEARAFALAELRKLHDAGELSDAAFDEAKERLVEREHETNRPSPPPARR